MRTGDASERLGQTERGSGWGSRAAPQWQGTRGRRRAHESGGERDARRTTKRGKATQQSAPRTQQRSGQRGQKGTSKGTASPTVQQNAVHSAVPAALTSITSIRELMEGRAAGMDDGANPPAVYPRRLPKLPYRQDDRVAGGRCVWARKLQP